MSKRYCPQCGMYVPTCPACAAKDAELEALKEFTAKLAEGRFAQKDGYTMLDFLKLWWEQEKSEGKKKDAEITRLTDALAVADEMAAAFACLVVRARVQERVERGGLAYCERLVERYRGRRAG